MILVDTSVWIDHLARGVPALGDRLAAGLVLTHPVVLAELALGSIRSRDAVLADLGRLPRALIAHDDEVLTLIEHDRLSGSGVGWADAHLLAATRLTPGARLWTMDRRLTAAAGSLGVD